MSNSKKYSKRLEALFSETPAPAPDPEKESVVAAPVAVAPTARNGQASAAEAELAQVRARVTELEAQLAPTAAFPAQGEDFGRLFPALTDLIIVYDADGRYLRVIPTDPALLYRAPDELVGRTMHELMPRAKADELLGHIRQALSQTHPVQAEYSLVIDGAELWFEARIVARTADTVFWVAQDITARKQADAALHDTEDRLVKMTDNVPGLIFQLVVPPDERPSYFTYASSWVFPRFGVTPQQLRESAHQLFAKVHPEDFPRFQSSLDDAARARVTWEWEGRVGFADGQLGVVQGRATPERQPGGEVVWHGMITDITDDKRAEEALRESEERFRDLFDNTADLIQNVALDGSFLYVNRAWLETLGYSEEDLPNLNLFDVIHPESQAHCMSLFGQIQAGVPSVYVQATFRTKTGQPIAIEGSTSTSFKNDRPFSTRGVFHNVTERRRSDEALRASEAKFRKMTVAVPGTIYQFHSPSPGEVSFDFVSDGAQALFEIPAHELQADVPRFMGLMHPDDAQAFLQRGIDSALTMTQFRWEGRVTTPSGKAKWVSATADPELRPEGDCVWYGIMTDITERKRNEEALARSAAELASVAKVATTAATLHESQEMLQSVVDLTKTEFALYHAHIYLLNEAGDTLALTAGAGEVGREMVAQGRRIPLNRAQSLVAQAARTRRGVIVNDVSRDPNFLPNALLPETQAEMAIPMIIGETVAGVLDVQSAIIQRFTETDLQIMTTLAAQVAVALQNAQLLERSARAAEDLNLLNRRLTREGWQDYLGTQRHLDTGYIYDQAQIRPLAAPEALSAPDNGHKVWPLKVQGEVIGNLAFADAVMPEAESAEIVTAVADRLGAHLETLRLNEEMQDNLAKQRRLTTELETVAEVTKAASTLLDSQVLLNSVVELAKDRFGLYHAQVYLFDEVSETLQVAAGSGSVGQQMTADGRYIPLLLERSIVARAARTLEPQLSNNVHESQDFLAYPLLPETRSELAIPMMSGDKLLGVYDLQSDEFNHFLPEDIRIQSTLAGQVAVALQNANLYTEQTAAVTRLQELDQLKSSFLANMSHELRTPLNSVLGFTDVILEGLDGPLTERMENDLKVVQKNGKHLLELINDVLDMAKIEAGRMTLSPEFFNLNEVVDEVFAITGSLVREKRLYLKDATPSYGELDLHADRVRLRQVLINVIGNAVKFTEAGGITLSAERVDENILIRVRDTGIGIPPGKVETVFEAFSQVDNSTTRKAGGTGLGLPISRRLIELHGGRLWAESSGIAGEGATFVVELPIEVKPLLAKDQA